MSRNKYVVHVDGLMPILIDADSTFEAIKNLMDWFVKHNPEVCFENITIELIADHVRIAPSYGERK